MILAASCLAVYLLAGFHEGYHDSGGHERAKWESTLRWQRKYKKLMRRAKRSKRGRSKYLRRAERLRKRWTPDIL